MKQRTTEVLDDKADHEMCEKSIYLVFRVIKLEPVKNLAIKIQKNNLYCLFYLNL